MRSQEISTILRRQIEGFEETLEATNVGQVVEVGDGIARIWGLSQAMAGELLEFPVKNEVTGEPVMGIVLNPVERIAPGVVLREPVETPVQTGIKAIDSMIPIGRGQRELIIGDRQTGKTAIAVDTIINQKGQDLVCIYVAIGQKQSTVAQVVAQLERDGAMEHTIVVVAAADESAALQYIAPYSGCAIGEEFMETGRDALI